MAVRASCAHCGKSIPEAHVAAGYVQRTERGLVCPLCVSRARAAVWTVPESFIDLRRARHIATGTASVIGSFWCLRHDDFLSTGAGIFLLLLSTTLLLYRVMPADSR